MLIGCTETQYQNKINIGHSSHCNLNIWLEIMGKRKGKQYFTETKWGLGTHDYAPQCINTHLVQYYMSEQFYVHAKITCKLKKSKSI